MTNMFSRISIVIVLGVLLVGCDSRFVPDDLFTSYIRDLNRSEHINIEVDSDVAFQPLPALRERQMALSQFDVGLLEFLSLQRCDVGALAGQRNSILGRVMPASQRLVYELDIIRAIGQCEIDNTELETKLTHVAQVKTSELPIAFSNVLWAGEETATFLSLANGYLPVAPEHSQYLELITALQHLVQVQQRLDKIPHVLSAEIEADMQAIYESEYLGKWLFSVLHITRYLNSVTFALERAAQDPSICGAPLSFLQQQFERHYIKVLQPYMARINRVAYQVLPMVEELASHSPIRSAAWHQYIAQYATQAKHSPWQNYLLASREHGQAWSQLLTMCGQTVGEK